MMGRSRHLDDDRLYECYLADRRGEARDLTAAEHLADCPDCSARYDEMSECLTAVRAEGEAEADAIFTTARLQAQQDAVLRRIAHASHPARVISFPGRVTRHMAGTSTRVSPRWLVAAAAAGLFVGVAVGGAFSTPRFRNSAVSSPATMVPNRVTTAPVARISAPAEAIEAADDDRFLLELEAALARPQTRELMPFDNLTPRARDIGTRLR